MKKNVREKYVFWIMGPTSSGKTTLAKLLHKEILASEKCALHYDGDEVRETFGKNFGFTNHDRLLVVKTLVYTAKKGVEAGLNVVVSALTAYEDARLFIKKNIKHLIVIYLRCSISECVRRDPKGLYAREKKGEINTLVGASSIYHEPLYPDIIIETENKTPLDSIKELVSELDNQKIKF